MRVQRGVDGTGAAGRVGDMVDGDLLDLHRGTVSEQRFGCGCVAITRTLPDSPYGRQEMQTYCDAHEPPRVKAEKAKR